MEILMAGLVLLAISIAVMVVVARWIFRINEIVGTLNAILAALSMEKPAPKQ